MEQPQRLEEKGVEDEKKRKDMQQRAADEDLLVFWRLETCK